MAAGQPVASLPMYDWPEVQWATDALWDAIADRLRQAGIRAPERLQRDRSPHGVWTDPELLLSQTCAWPYVTRLRGSVGLVATPIYDVDGCSGGFYSSFLVAREDTPGDALGASADRRFAINSRDSLSGYIALRAAMSAEALDAADVEWLETGSHRASIRAVAEGAADVAAIDAICWALAGRHEPAAEHLRIITRTPLRPGLPFITATASSPELVHALRAALQDAAGSEDTLPARQALFLAGIERLDEADYAALLPLAPEELPQARPESLASRG